MKAKKLLSLTLAAMLVLSLCACGNTSAPSSAPGETTVPATTAPNYGAFLDEGLMLLDSGDLQGAMEKFAQAGPAGEQQMELLRKEYTDPIMDAAETYVPDAIAMLQELPEGLLSEEETLQLLAELYRMYADVYARQINANADYVSWYPGTLENIQALSDEIANSALAGTAEGQSVIDYNNFLLGIMRFQDAYDTYEWEDPGFEEAYQIFASCAEGSEGYDVAQAIDMIREGKFLEAAELLKTHIHSSDRIMGFITRYTPHGDDQTLNTKLSYTRALDIVDGDVTIKTLETMMDNSTTYTVGIIDADGISEAQYSDLLSLTATAPAGKILVLHRWSEFGTGEKNINLDLGLMRTLPDEYYPGSLEEVEFVILMDATYERTGAYESGTVRIHETTTLTLYNAAGEELYTETVEGLDDDYMYYFGEAPEYYSAASPDMKAALEQAFALIATQ